MMRFRLTLALVAAGVMGCASPYMHQGQGQTQQKALLDRASFDFSCPRDTLKATAITNMQTGVEGCGKRGVYVLMRSGWVLNSTDGEVSKNKVQ